ncbi:Hypothetical predicted protein [Paramuricea clavata]|uniref:Uncharacterized protein n=1 Tax=Paramuricea clavata TaxID=317549 RepID=A0A7D9E8T4_PARCT|nr:Hypothetical predicted protein [Paramuricea clavata]
MANRDEISSCVRSKIRITNQDPRLSIPKRYKNYIFRAKFEQSKRNGTNWTLLIKVLFQSPCTSRQLPPVTHLLLEKSCKKKIKKSDGEVLILAKKGKKQIDMVIKKIYITSSKADMKKALRKHKCPSKKRNNKKQSGNHKG